MSTHAAVSRPVRLAERDSLAVDLCPCGTLAVHMGPLSVRLGLESISELISVLIEAVAKHDALRPSAEARAADTWRAGAAQLAVHSPRRRGKA